MPILRRLFLVTLYTTLVLSIPLLFFTQYRGIVLRTCHLNLSIWYGSVDIGYTGTNPNSFSIYRYGVYHWQNYVNAPRYYNSWPQFGVNLPWWFIFLILLPLYIFLRRSKPQAKPLSAFPITIPS